MDELDMKLWLLKPVQGLPKELSPWVRWDEMTMGLVVRAATELEAREMANSAVCHEFHGNPVAQRPWMDSSLSTCAELIAAGNPGVILSDYRMCH